jgi:cytochrome P450
MMTETWLGTGTWNDQIGPRGQACPHLSTTSPEFTDDFEVVTDRARKECPVAWDEGGRRWFVTAGETLMAVAQACETYSSAYGVGGPQFPKLLPMDADEPEHRQWRRPLNPLFTRAVHETQRPQIRRIAHELIDDFIGKGQAELVADFCRPLPGRVFFQLIIDLPAEDLEHLQHVVEITVDPADPEAQVAAATELAAYVQNLVDERRAAPPTDDLIGRVVFAEVNGKQVSAADAVSALTMIILGGLETTTNTLAGAFAHLARDPELQSALRANRDLVRPAVEEFLRLYSPTSFLTRYVTRDVELEGLSIKQGQRVALSFAAANRDPAIFEQPHEFSLDRPHNRHYAFGVGPHRCLGSNLARAVMHEAVNAVLDRLADIRWAPGFTPKYRYVGIRSLDTVELTFTAGA